MKPETIITIAVMILGLVGAVYAGYDLFQKRRSTGTSDVVQSAVALLKPYKDEVRRLGNELAGAHTTIESLKIKLSETEGRADRLNKSLIEAQAELSFLRIQVNNMRGTI